MSSEQYIYKLSIEQFLSRFRNSKKLDDLFSRGYTLCSDTATGHRSILKFYSIQTVDQEQAVLENLMNFAKLNQVQGICKFIAYAIAESGTELISAFQYHPLTLGQFVKVLKDLGIDKADRQLMYIQVMRQLLKIIATGVEIGIQFDDVNRETVIIKESPLLHQHNLPPRSSQQIKPMPIHHSINIFYDERQKQYNRLESTSLSLSPPSSSSLSPSSSTSLNNGNNNNKIYWSVQKIENQILKGRQYSMSQGEQSIYQLGLMMLDVAYELEKFYHSGSSNSIQPDYDQLKPDEIVAHTENALSYYQIDRALRKVERNQILVSHRLNYLINSSDQLNKEIGILLKSMITLASETRADINRVDGQLHRLLQFHRYRPSIFKPQTPMRGLQKNSESIRSIQSNQEEAINFPSSETLQIVSSVPKFPSSDNIDSLKYSQNSIGNPNQNIFDTLKLANSSNSYAPVQKSVGSPSALGKNRSPGSYESGGQNIEKGSVDLSGNLTAEEIVCFWKGNHEGLKQLLRRAVNQIEEIKKVSPVSVIRKQYIDKSIYFGCVDSSSKREGLGVYIYKTGDIYFGAWKDNSLTDGTYLFKNGQSFEGVVKSGKQGQGVYRYSNGNIYDGQWKDDLKNGRGTMIYPNGARYEGQWLKGKKHGDGIYFYENGIQYKGGFALGKKYGNGTFLFPGGTRVEGFWDNNHLEGAAKIFYKNGDYYQGNLHLSEKSGQGTYRWNSKEQGQVEYKGQFSKDSLDGFAVIRFKNGQLYQGRVKNGKRDGQGNYRYSNGDEFRGEWKNDDKKIGKYAFITGDTFEGNFKEGQMAFGVMKYQNGEIYEGDFYRGERHGVGTYSNKLGHIVYEGRWQRDQYTGPNRY